MNWCPKFKTEKQTQGWLEIFQGLSPGLRGHKLKDQFLKIVDIKKGLR